MYEDFLETILGFIKALNQAGRQVYSEDSGPCGELPILGDIPVIFEGEIVGHLVDELGGEWSYRELPPAPPASEVDVGLVKRRPDADMLRVDL